MDKEKWNFGLAIAAIVIALMAAGFTAAQWYEARQTRIDDEKHFDIARQDAAKASSDQQAQVERSAASAERSAKSSEKSTDVAGDSLRLSRQVFQTSERAFIHVKQITFVVEPNKPAKVIVQFENVGRTTAKPNTLYGEHSPREHSSDRSPPGRASIRATDPNGPRSRRHKGVACGHDQRCPRVRNKQSQERGSVPVHLRAHRVQRYLCPPPQKHILRPVQRGRPQQSASVPFLEHC